MDKNYLAPNRILGNRYIIIRLLAEGGMGTVYEAKDIRLGSTVALKKTLFTEDYLQKQFEREARLLANLRHIGLPKVIDHFTDESGQFLVMEFIKGQDLKSLLDERKSPFPHKDVLIWGEQLLNVLQYLHSRQPPVIHRDIKPQNLKINDEGIVILLDFGLAKGEVPDMTRVAVGNTLLGCTPEYAPLEQLMRVNYFMRKATSTLDNTQLDQIISEYTDVRADLYSLAATMYHLMTGVTPTTSVDRFTETVRGQRDPLRPANEVHTKIPSRVAGFLLQAMAIKREQRFTSAKAMMKALKETTELINIKPRLIFKDAKTPQGATNPEAKPTSPIFKGKETNVRPRLIFKGAKAPQGVANPEAKSKSVKVNYPSSARKKKS